MFVRIIGINPKYLMPLKPTPYSQGDVAKLLRNGIKPLLLRRNIFGALLKSP